MPNPRKGRIMFVLEIRHFSQEGRKGRERWEKEGTFDDKPSAIIAGRRSGYFILDRRIREIADGE
jgi:hypothetical protein